MVKTMLWLTFSQILKPFDVEDSFTEDIMPEFPDPRCEQFFDYMVENYVTVYCIKDPARPSTSPW